MLSRFTPLLFNILLLSSIVRGSNTCGRCKVTVDSPGWPSSHAWGNLGKSLEGRLLQPAPPGAVCHEGQPTYDPEKCSAVTEGWALYEFHVSDPISVMWNQYANDTCLPDPSDPCNAAGYPVFVINATTPRHVKLGVDFAREHNIRLIIRSTGHDYMGRSSAPNSLSIWTHHMQSIETHAHSFQPRGCDVTIPSSAITVGAGVQMEDMFTYLDTLNQTIVGGSGRTVGVSGYVTGAGHSPLAPRYGLGADNVLQMEAVTPSGEIVTINECQHEDLFWAMRGGGGSTFGALTSVTLKTHPSPKMLSMEFMLLADIDQPFIYDMYAYILSQLPTLGDKGVNANVYTFQTMENPIPGDGAPEEVSGVLGLAAIQDTSNPDDLLELWKPINKTISARWPSVRFVQKITPFDSYLEWLDGYFDNRTTGSNSYVASRLLDAEALTSDPEALSEATRIVTEATGGFTSFLVSGNGVRDADVRGGSNAVCPGWRQSYVLAISGLEFPPLNATAKAQTIEKLNKIMEPLRRLAPNTGSYLNEANPYEPDWQRSFWGDNYERLLDIKRRADPDNVLWCPLCVGSEGWEEVGTSLCKVKG